LNKDKKEWIEWTKEKADWYEPFIEKEVELLKGICINILKLENYTVF
jgi:hypothetical protein